MVGGWGDAGWKGEKDRCAMCDSNLCPTLLMKIGKPGSEVCSLSASLVHDGDIWCPYHRRPSEIY